MTSSQTASGEFERALRRVEKAHLESLEAVRSERDSLARQLLTVDRTPSDSEEMITFGQAKSATPAFEPVFEDEGSSTGTVDQLSPKIQYSAQTPSSEHLQRLTEFTKTTEGEKFLVGQVWVADDVVLEKVKKTGTWNRNYIQPTHASKVDVDCARVGAAEISKSRGSWWVEPPPDVAFHWFPLMHPYALPRVCWNLPCIALICYDIAYMPVNASFDVPHFLLFSIMDWFIALFWTADLVFNFFTSFVNGKAVETEPLIAWKKYATTWMVPDIVVVITEWTSRVSEASFSITFVRFTRALRFIRFIKILRVRKFSRALRALEDQFHSNIFLIVARLLKLCTILAVTAHIVACTWYGIGRNARHANGWVTYYTELMETDASYIPVTESWEGLVFWYFASARWTLAQINGRTDQNTRRNTGELVFTCLVSGGVAVIFMAVFVGSITTTMLEASALAKQRSARLQLVNEYLEARSISPTLKYRLKMITMTWKSEKDLAWETERRVLASLPKQLQQDLQWETRGATVSGHPLLSLFSSKNPRVLRHICYAVMQPVTAMMDEVVFDVGDACSRMLFVQDGATLFSAPTQAGLNASSGTEVDQMEKVTYIAAQGRRIADDEQRIAQALKDRFLELMWNSGSHVTRYDGRGNNIPFFDSVGPSMPTIHALLKGDTGRESGRSVNSKPLPLEVDSTRDFLPRSTRISEPALWMAHWVNQGRLAAIDDTCFLSLEASELGDVLINYPKPRALAVMYAQAYVAEASVRRPFNDVTSLRFFWSKANDDLEDPPDTVISLDNIVISQACEDSEWSSPESSRGVQEGDRSEATQYF